MSFRRCDWLFPPSAREFSPGNRSNYKSTRERVDSKGLYGRWRLHLMGSWRRQLCLLLLNWLCHEPRLLNRGGSHQQGQVGKCNIVLLMKCPNVPGHSKTNSFSSTFACYFMLSSIWPETYICLFDWLFWELLSQELKRVLQLAETASNKQLQSSSLTCCTAQYLESRYGRRQV